MGSEQTESTEERSDPLRILLLHALPSPRRRLRWAIDTEMLFRRMGDETRILTHHVDQDVPDFVKEFPFDAILITSSCIAKTIPERHLASMMHRLDFVRHSNAVKVAFSQDDYFFSDVRDDLYVHLGLNLLYSVCAPHYWNRLMPKFLDSGGLVRRGYTSYVTPSLRDFAGSGMALEGRPKDVIYRTFGDGVFPHVIGSMKSELGSNFSRAVQGQGLRLDISNKKKDMLRGDDWMSFLAGSRAALGSPSGSSVIVRSHEVGRRAREIRYGMRNATAGHLEEMCYVPGDRGLSITALSPRNLEAAAAGTAQILVRNDFEGKLTPWQHYVPLEADLSNVEEVVESIRDLEFLKRIANQAWDQLMSLPELQVENHVQEVYSYIIEERRERGQHTQLTLDKFFDMERRYQKDTPRPSRRGELKDFVADYVPNKWLTFAARHGGSKRTR